MMDTYAENVETPITVLARRRFQGDAPAAKPMNRLQRILFFTVAAYQLPMPLKLPGWFADRRVSQPMNFRAGLKPGK